MSWVSVDNKFFLLHFFGTTRSGPLCTVAYFIPHLSTPFGCRHVVDDSGFVCRSSFLFLFLPLHVLLSSLLSSLYSSPHLISQLRSILPSSALWARDRPLSLTHLVPTHSPSILPSLLVPSPSFPDSFNSSTPSFTFLATLSIHMLCALISSFFFHIKETPC